MKKLKLYYFKSCPYCQKVLRYLERNNINLEMKNIRKDQEARRELKEFGGKIQVPCLFINGRPLYESDDIINWLDENYHKN